MTAQTTGTSPALAEWRRGWTLPVAAGLGYSMAVLHIYGISPFVLPIQEAFGWTRAQVTSGLTITALTGGAMAVPLGMLVDRVGPRLVGIVGVLLTALAFAALGTATGSTANWIMLWCLLAVGVLMVQATVWASAIASQFEHSRGLALAVTLSGASLGATLFPLISGTLIANYDWRTGFMGTGLIWGAIALPMVFFFFRSAKDTGGESSETPEAETKAAADTADLPGLTLAEGVRAPAFYKLILAGVMFAFTTVGMTVHFVPILSAAGTDPLKAAGTASLIGIFSIIGRLGTGALLDRFSGRVVGAIAFLIPIPACFLLLYTGDVTSSQVIAAAIFGLTLGSEVDVVVYLATRHFGLKNFGTLYGALLTAMSIGMAIGPLVGAHLFDISGSYNTFLWAVIGLNLLSSAALASLPPPPFAGQSGH